jgi:glycosyltransferase involved in cell wall biosynthesis
MTLYLVLPCYNEEAVLPETSRRLKEKYTTLMEAGKISPDSRIVFVNDGSKDKTWDMICDLHRSDPLFRGICLSRNRGHQNALMAGLMTVREECDAVISMDADLQDDINAIDAMVDRYNQGYEVVYGVRSSRKKDTFFKRTTAQGFYKLMKAMGVETVYNHADYRLMSRRALEALSQFEEVNLFLRGMVPLVGFKSTTVSYERGERFAGESKYPLKKMVSFAFEGITSMSVKPIRMIATLGGAVFAVSLVILLYSLIRHFTGHTVEGWTFLAVSIWALGGIQLLAIGVIGEYIGKIYLETKHRPKYVISQYLKDETCHE